jgi:two-component system sensor histidine kinase QseC
MRSTRVFLIVAILATLTLFNFLAALQGYNSSLNEAEKLFDNQLLDTTKLISSLHPSQHKNSLTHLNDMAYQIWHHNKLLGASSNVQKEPITALHPGFGYANFNGYRWRTLVYFDELQDRWIITAERTDLRFSLAENVIIKAVLPILLGIPLIGFLIWFIVSQGLKPLRDLSDQLKNKQVNDLSPIELPDPQKELEHVIYSINSLIKRLGEALEREKRFTADAAHELRTPISALKIQLHNLKNDPTSGEETFLQLQSGVERMQHLVEQLLSLYRSTPSEFSNNFTPINLYQLAQEVIAEQHLSFEQKHQSLELTGTESLINGDLFSLQTLMQNLLSNANKYTPNNGTIKVSVSNLSQQLDDTPKVYLKIEDSGIGIDPTDYHKIYERFQRLNKKDVAATPGCGLGLTIVRHIVELHGGSIHISPSSVPSGTTFTVLFDGLNK